MVRPPNGLPVESTFDALYGGPILLYFTLRTRPHTRTSERKTMAAKTARERTLAFLAKQHRAG
jgi:hypothetical protein